MKKLIILITIMIAFFSCKVDNSVDGRIKSALIEYYEPERTAIIPLVGELDIIHKNYEYQSHKILLIAHYGEDATEYTIEHKYKIDIVAHDKHNRKHINTVNCTDTIKVTLYEHIYYSKVDDGTIWKY